MPKEHHRVNNVPRLNDEHIQRRERILQEVYKILDGITPLNIVPGATIKQISHRLKLSEGIVRDDLHALCVDGRLTETHMTIGPKTGFWVYTWPQNVRRYKESDFDNDETAPVLSLMKG